MATRAITLHQTFMFVSFSYSDRTLANVISGVFQKFFPSLTKVVGTLGPNSRSVEVIEACLEAGMSGKTLKNCSGYTFCTSQGTLELVY